jgi:hypothetical protein
MTKFTHKPDISVKRSPRVTRSMRRLVDKICRRHSMFESEVLRFCLEAIAPEAAKRGVPWLTSQIKNFDRLGDEALADMITVRMSRKTLSEIERARGRDYSQVEMLRYCYEASLSIALKSFGKIMAMREKNLAR